MTSLLSALAYSCPLILCSLGALFSEYAGCLALFMDGLVSFAAFLNYAFTVWSGSAVVGVLVSCLLSVGITLGLSAVVEKFRANRFIAAIAMNLLFGALTSCLSWAFFGTRGVLAGDVYRFGVGERMDYDDARNIVAVTRDPFYKLPYVDGKKKYRYAVTALNRIQNESKPRKKSLRL